MLEHIKDLLIYLLRPFKITSKTTGESHVVVTDKNGQFSTASSWVSHKQNTNVGKTNEDGIWFGTGEPDDSKGALLYDTYEIEELRSESNKQFKLIPAFDVVVSRDNYVIDLGTLINEYEKELTIHTNATDKAIGNKTIEANEAVSILDTVTLDGLEVGTKYQLKGWQMIKADNTELIIDGKRVENDLTFIARESKMVVEIDFTFNASKLAGKELVTFEELYDLSNPDEPVKVAEHKDIEDMDQTVTIIKKQKESAVAEKPTLPTPIKPDRPTPINVPKTGDESNTVVLLSLLSMSFITVACCSLLQYRKKNKGK